MQNTQICQQGRENPEKSTLLNSQVSPSVKATVDYLIKSPLASKLL